MSDCNKNLFKVKTDLACFEYLLHSSSIFLQYFMNSRAMITKDNFDEIKLILKKSLMYLQTWYESSKKNDKSERKKEWSRMCINKLTLTKMNIGVCEFFTYATNVFNTCENNKIYIPFLHSNTSTLEAVFSFMRSINADTPISYQSKIASSNLLKNMKRLASQ
mgnify:CR=1 FL=1